MVNALALHGMFLESRSLGGGWRPLTFPEPWSAGPCGRRARSAPGGSSQRGEAQESFNGSRDVSYESAAFVLELIPSSASEGPSAVVDRMFCFSVWWCLDVPRG